MNVLNFDFIGRYSKVNEFDINQNGLQVVENDKYIEIYNDCFGTVPLFVLRNKKNEIIVFSKFDDFYKFENIDVVIDIIGFWEIVLFGSGLWTRTLYKNIEQMPGASKIIINKSTNDYVIERYWDFNVEENSSIDSTEKAAKGLYDKLDDIFSKLDKNQKYIMGMSGGLDSRITLAFLSKHISKKYLKLFTYGFDERILEYKYAKEVAKALECDRPCFHELTKAAYEKAMTYLPRISGGQISINHCHILDYLKYQKLECSKQISTYYSDAIFGWDSVLPKSFDDISDNYYIKSLERYDFISSEIKEKIKEDSIKIFEGLGEKSNYSSLDEYKYVTERNPKFHMYLASLQNEVVSTEMPYANHDLLKYILSIPIKYREQKRLVDYMLDNYFKNISPRDFKNISSRDFKNISSTFQWGSRFSGIIDWYYFKFLNRVNSFLRLLVKGEIQLFNKYQTEDQDRLLRKDFHGDLKNATAEFVNINIMTREQKQYWDKLPLRASGVGERFSLISLNQLIKEQGDGK